MYSEEPTDYGEDRDSEIVDDLEQENGVGGADQGSEEGSQTADEGVLSIRVSSCRLRCDVMRICFLKRTS